MVDPRKVLQEIENFYCNLYQKDDLDPSENLINTFLKNSQIPKLSVDKIKACEGKLTIDECLKSLNSFDNNKSPGNDGLTAEFYKAFWNVMGDLMVSSLNIMLMIMANCRTHRSKLL